jgi:hypothetical protein
MPEQQLDLSTASDGDLRTISERIASEVTRREAEDQAVKAARFRQELAEVEAGTREARREHILATDAQTTARWVSEGKLTHLGYGASKRRGRR